MRWGIRYQVLVPVLVLLLGVVGASTWLAVRSAESAVRHQIEAQLRQVARTLDRASFPFTERVLEQVEDLSGARCLIVTADGRRLAAPRDPPVEPPAEDAPAEDWENLRLGPTVSAGGESYLSSKVRLRSVEGGAATLYLLYPESRWRDALWHALRPALLLGLVGGVGSVALALAVATWLARRVRSLEQRTRLIAAGDFRPMPLPGWDDELRDLAVSVNEMADHLARLQDAVRKAESLRLLGQVAGGLAHQLRNGVTGARLAVQVHARECAGPDDPEALAVALRQLALVEEKLRRFLHLGGEDRPDPRPCSLPGLIEEAVSLVRPQCRHTHVELTWRPPPDDVTVLGDASQLGQLFLNVLGNAVEAAGPGGRVEVSARLRTDPACALVEVTDSGPGPPPEIAGRLFEEFVTSKPGGVGLGLAVARQVTEAHGGRIEWGREQGLTHFRITLPTGPAGCAEMTNDPPMTHQ
jgi:signal transduction histidine kinase